MKIGMLVDTYKPYISGVTNYVSLNKKYLEDLGHEVYVFTFGDLDYADDETRIIRSPGISLVDTGFHIGFSMSVKARRLLYTMDLVHVHHPFQSGPVALRYCKPRHIPVVFTNHTRYDLYAQVYLPMLIDSLTEGAIRAYLPPFCRACDMVVAPSPSLKEVLISFGVDSSVEVVPNGVDLEPFTCSKESLDRLQFGVQEDEVILMYVGRLGPEKNLAFLLRSFAGAAQAYDKIHLFLVGEGTEKDNLIDRASHMGLEGRVHFTGLVPYQDLPAYLAMADAFVTASVTEVHPLSVIEAMAAGLPVLGIQAPGIKDCIEDGVSGLMAADDLAAFTAKMVKLVTDRDLCLQLGSHARKAVEKFDIRLTSRTMEMHYKHLVAEAIRKHRGPLYRLTHFLDRWH